MNLMQRAFAQASLDLLQTDPSTVLLFAGSGIVDQSIFSDFKHTHPNRIVDVGISEQLAVGMMAGLSLGGLKPIFHTQAPFMVERALEQLKLDICYQNLTSCFVSLGSSLEFTFLGPTHHCPADIGLLASYPNMQIFLPSTIAEFESIYKRTYGCSRPSYIRISRDTNESYSAVVNDDSIGKGFRLRDGQNCTVLVIGPLLDIVLDATSGLDLSVLYYNSLSPFDSQLLRNTVSSTAGKLLVVEPFYEGTTATLVAKALGGLDVSIDFLGLPRLFYSSYGLSSTAYEAAGLNPSHIRQRIHGLNQ